MSHVHFAGRLNLSIFGSFAGGVIQGCHQQINLPVSRSNLMSKTKPRVRKAWFSKSASGLLVVVQVLAAKASNHHGAELTDLVDLPGIFCVEVARLLPSISRWNNMRQVWCSHLGSGPDCQVWHTVMKVGGQLDLVTFSIKLLIET